MKKKIKNVDLLRKLAWSFHKSTGLEWKDLFQEAALGYLMALDTYDPSRGAPSTHMWTCISSHLKNYVKRELAYKEALCPMDTLTEDRECTTIESILERFSETARPIIETVFASPETFDGLTRREAKAKIALLIMQQKGGTFFSPSVKQGMLEIKAVLRS